MHKANVRFQFCLDLSNLGFDLSNLEVNLGDFAFQIRLDLHDLRLDFDYILVAKCPSASSASVSRCTSASASAWLIGRPNFSNLLTKFNVSNGHNLHSPFTLACFSI